MTHSPLQFGIIGTGQIAKVFRKAVAALEEACVSAVLSRTAESGKKFAEEFAIPAYFSDPEEFFAQEFEAVYVAVPHSHHYEYVKAALEHGKHVLCEKPFTVNAKQAEELIALAEEKGLFLMEAMWSRFLPAKKQALEWIREGRIGKVQLIQSDFSCACPFTPGHRLFEPGLAGGALLDIGIYCVSLTASILGNHPKKIQSHAVLAPTGVDQHGLITMEYEDGAMAICTSSLNFNGSLEAVIYGERGKIVLPKFYEAQEALLFENGTDQPVERFVQKHDHGFRYQILETVECIRRGKTESAWMNHQDTVEVLQLCDAIRAQMGVVYPGE